MFEKVASNQQNCFPRFDILKDKHKFGNPAFQINQFLLCQVLYSTTIHVFHHHANVSLVSNECCSKTTAKTSPPPKKKKNINFKRILKNPTNQTLTSTSPRLSPPAIWKNLRFSTSKGPIFKGIKDFASTSCVCGVCCGGWGPPLRPGLKGVPQPQEQVTYVHHGLLSTY